MKFIVSLFLLCNVIHLNGMEMEIVQEKSYNCMCGKQYIRKSAFETHLRKNDKTYCCKMCDKRISFTCCFQKHLEMDHQIQLHLCGICNTTFSYRHNLLTHIKKEHAKPAVTFAPTVTFVPIPSPTPHLNHDQNLIPISHQIYFGNLVSLISTKNFSFQRPIDNSLFLQWMHNT